ncbi:unnamed protein product [Camellia sinensis]
MQTLVPDSQFTPSPPFLISTKITEPLTMPFILDAASAIKSRFGFQDQFLESMPSVRSSPDLLKSASHDNLYQSSAVRVFDKRDDLGAGPVIIKVRPLSSSDISLQGYSRCVRQDSCQTITWTGHPESRFTFDVVADENVSQEKLYWKWKDTMLGDIEGGTQRRSVNCGMTPRVFEYLFSRIQK